MLIQKHFSIDRIWIWHGDLQFGSSIDYILNPIFFKKNRRLSIATLIGSISYFLRKNALF